MTTFDCNCLILLSKIIALSCPEMGSNCIFYISKGWKRAGSQKARGIIFNISWIWEGLPYIIQMTKRVEKTIQIFIWVRLEFLVESIINQTFNFIHLNLKDSHKKFLKEFFGQHILWISKSSLNLQNDTQKIRCLPR